VREPSVPSPQWRFRLGDTVHELANHTLVMGILNRTPDSFYDRGATFALDELLRRAEVLAAHGADILDVGGVKAGPGPAVTEAEELDRVVPAIEALHAHIDVAISVDTWRATVLDEACKAGAVVGNDISGFGDPDYLSVAARHAASVVATHIRLQPRVPDPEPHYEDLLQDVSAFLVDRAHRAEDAGLAPEHIAIDAGLDLGKTPAMSAVLLRESDTLAALGYTLLLSASNKRFFGELLALDIDERRDVSLAAVGYGVMHGCRIVRVHDVAGSVKICRMIEALLRARDHGAVTR
jgi:dihydropteroate synthase